jgi:hypothetical protein
LDEGVTYQNASQRQEGLVDIRAAFVAHAQAPVLVQPRERALDHPARLAQGAAVFGVAFGGSEAMPKSFSARWWDFES